MIKIEFAALFQSPLKASESDSSLVIFIDQNYTGTHFTACFFM